MGGGLTLVVWGATQQVVASCYLWCPVLEEYPCRLARLKVWLLSPSLFLGGLALGFSH